MPCVVGGQKKKKRIRTSSCSQESSRPSLGDILPISGQILMCRWHRRACCGGGLSGLATVSLNLLSAGLMRRSQASAHRVNVDGGQAGWENSMEVPGMSLHPARKAECPRSLNVRIRYKGNRRGTLLSVVVSAK